MLNPNSPQALSISNLFLIALAFGALIFVIVTGLVIYIAVRFRRRSEGEEPRQDFGRTPLEIGWTVGPALILLVLFILTVKGMEDAEPAVGSGTQPNITIIAHQWWWEIGYPGTSVITSANEIHLPAGERMLVHLELADVIHDLWIPQLGPKKDMIPGQPTDVWLEADKPGVYLGQCAEYCGVAHGQMLIRAIAQPRDEFDAWLASQSTPAQAFPSTGSIGQGASLFQQRTCISCHAINGTQANAQVGPNLTHLASRQTLAAGTLDNTPDNLAHWLKDPQGVKPGNHMPNLQLTEDQVNALVAYLESLK